MVTAWRAAIVMAVVVLAVVVLVGCRPAGTAEVAVVGDSITAYSGPQITAALAGRTSSVKGVPAIDLADGRTRLVVPAVASDPKVLVVELGVNSALDGWDSSDLPALEAILRSLDGADCVVWVTVTALAPSYYDHLGPGTLQARAAGFRASLVRRLPQHRRQHLADFTAAQLAHPEWFTDDHLHPTTAGKKALAAHIAGSIGVCS